MKNLSKYPLEIRALKEEGGGYMISFTDFSDYLFHVHEFYHKKQTGVFSPLFS
jgi:hypothetical protein